MEGQNVSERSSDGNFDFSGRSIVGSKVEKERFHLQRLLYHCNTASPFALKGRERKKKKKEPHQI